ncbi:MAG: inositol monophosphatase [Candidatus Calescibacterium sp.]|nr:inositol monophosphatase [Candidatus Calescibacterium sp.]MCX7733324.1 inositol monophosphatase [bacterium]MDW8086754.1 inositol monophosphatase family protein [Candidatus Calescibacterium sp.]
MIFDEWKALQVAKETALKSGELLKQYFYSDESRFEEKGISDWVSEADRKSEQAIVETLQEKFPADFVGEEFGERRKGSDFVWYIDPLDGTKNFVRKIPLFCVSIALAYKNEIVLGVVYSPIDQKMFWATKGGGAYMNSKRIKVSEERDLKRCLVATGLPFRSKDFIDKHLSFYKNIFLKGAGIRHIGSAALEMCYVASGAIDGFWEIGLSSWDLAAGSLIVKEANGIVSDIWGGNSFFETGCIICSNREIYPEILKSTKEIFSNI